jgi:hypothetical protein
MKPGELTPSPSGPPATMNSVSDTPELDELVRSEMRMEALKGHGEAWASGISQGIDPQILADTALYTAFHELIRSGGEDAALDLVDRLKERILCGEFEPERIRH